MKTILLLSQLLVSTSFAFTLVSNTNSNFKGWNSPEIQFQLNLANCPASVDVRGIVNDALALWNNVPNSNLKLTIVGDTTTASASNPIPIICDTDYASGDASAQDGSPGQADYQPRTGDVITSGIMYLNASAGRANIANFSRDIVAVTLAHEMGHLIGFGHSQDVNALMYFDAGLKNRLALAQDDMDAVAYLYPRDEFGKDKMLGGCGTLGRHLPPPRGPSSGWLLFALVLPLFVYAGLRARARHSIG